MTEKELRLSAVTTYTNTYSEAQDLLKSVKLHFDIAVEAALNSGCTIDEINEAKAKAVDTHG